MKSFAAFALLLAAGFAVAAAPDTSSSDSAVTPNSAWCENFRNAQAKNKNGVVLPQNWQREGGKIGVPMTVCTIVEDKELHAPVLLVHADRSTGGIICDLTGKVDLTKTPILRWRWRVMNLPAGGDGRNADKDDQPIAIYLGTGGWFQKQSIAYRWETETPKGYEDATSYGGGIVQVHYLALCDKSVPLGVWRTESRNVAEDFKRIYGSVPKKFAISIMGNSQYTKSDTRAEIAFLEFLPAPQP